MLADPQSVTINAVAYSLARISTEPNKGVYQDATGAVQERVSQSYGRRTRRAIQLQHTKIAPDPFVPAQNVNFSTTVSVVFDVPKTGYTTTELKQIWDGFAAQLAASSGAMVTKVLGGEN